MRTRRPPSCWIGCAGGGFGHRHPGGSGQDVAETRVGVGSLMSTRSTGPLEGTNNKIKTMQRQADGYRDEEFFKLKIYAIHEAKYALVG